MMPDFNKNNQLLIDKRTIDDQEVEFVTSSDNLIVIYVKDNGLGVYCPKTPFFEAQLKKSGIDLNDPKLHDFDYTCQEFGPRSYGFRFSESSFNGLPSELLNFCFDMLLIDKNVVSASITEESHPVIAITRALVDLGIQTTEIRAMSLRIEYCGEVVFRSPKSLINDVLKRENGN